MHSTRKIGALLIVLALLLPAFAEAKAPPYRTVSFPGIEKDGPAKLPGAFFKPKGTGPFPAIVGLHGCFGLYDERGKLSSREAAWAAHLVRKGYAVLLPDSYAPRGLKTNCGFDKLVSQESRIEDAYGALRYLQALPSIRADRIAVMGWSEGAAAGLAAVDTSQARQFARPGAAMFRAVAAFYPHCRGGRVTSWHSPARALIFFGGYDIWAPAEDCLPAFEEAKTQGDLVEIKIYPGVYHDFDFPDMPLHILTVVPRQQFEIGTDKGARDDALERVPAFFAEALKD